MAPPNWHIFLLCVGTYVVLDLCEPIHRVVEVIVCLVDTKIGCPTVIGRGLGQRSAPTNPWFPRGGRGRGALMFETKPISHNALHFVTSVYHSFMASIFFFNAINVGLFFFLSMGCLSLFLICCSIQVLLMFSSLDLLINYDLGECNLHMAYFCEFMVYLHESASAWRVQDTMSTS